MQSWYVCTVDSDGSGDGDNLSATNVPQWNGMFHGELKGVRVEFGGTPDAATDTILSETTGLQRTLLTLTNVITDGVYNPVDVRDDGTGSALTDYQPFIVDSNSLKVLIAQAVISTTAAVTCKVLIEE